MRDQRLPARRRRTAEVCRSRLLLTAVAALPLLGGCSTLTHVVAHPVVTGIGLVSVVVTGKGLADHALDMVTRRDCRILEGLLKEERALCEPPGSLATLDDFRGVGWPGRDGDDGTARDTGLALDTNLDGPGNGLMAAAASGPDREGALRLALSLAPRSLAPVAGPAPDGSQRRVALVQ